MVAQCDRNNSLWITVLLICTPMTAWSILVVPQLVDELGMDCVLVAYGLLAINLVSLLLTWLVEPGILPSVEMEDRSFPDKPKRLVFVFWGGLYYTPRVFRAQQSRYTDNCIEHFDHYCPYVGNAVGKRNYRYFIMFLMSSTLVCCYIAGICCYLVVRRERDMHPDQFVFWEAVQTSPSASVLGLCCLVLGISVGLLLAYHVKIISRGVTTFEDVKQHFLGRQSPHHLGCLRNWVVLWCSPHFPSRIATSSNHDALLHEQLEEKQVEEEQVQDVLHMNEALLFSPSTPS